MNKKLSDYCINIPNKAEIILHSLDILMREWTKIVAK